MRRLLPALTTALVAGCVSPGGASPEAVWSAAQEALDRRDWKAYYRCLYPDTAHFMILMFQPSPLLDLCDEESQRDWERLSAKHRTALAALDVREPLTEPLRLTDGESLLADLMAFNERHRPDKLPRAAGGTVRVVEMDGDWAKSDSGDLFARRNGRWYLVVWPD